SSSSTTTTSPLSKLESNVRETMKKAFWNILEEQLAEQPPNYQQAISLLNEIKETLLLFLMPQHVQLKNEIDEILDIELIKQKICSRLCCPVRDEMIKKLTEIKDMIPLFKGIFELLEVMRLDFANFYIQQFRPHIQLASVEYEREKFKNLIEAHQKYQIDVLEYTSKWIRRNYDCLDLSHETDMKKLFNKVLISSYIDLLQCLNPSFNCYMINNSDEQKTEDDYPETLLLIRNRIDLVREKIFKVTLISSVFVVTFAAIGEPLQSIKDFRLKLKQDLEAIMNTSSGDDEQQQKIPLQYLKLNDLKSMLTSISIQVRTSIEKALNDYQAPGLSETKLDSLKYQINELSTPGNRIRSVMERRILEFIERVIQSPSSQTAAPIQVPSGLSTFANELIQIASEFTRFVSYNRAVYSPYYTKIIAEIAGPTHFIPQNELKTIEKSFYG
ncbi:T-complex protein 11, partial [Dermatophagoides pteronyssinus]